MVKAVVPGSFDPITNGHIDIIERGSSLFDEVIVAVLHNSRKNPLFSLEEKQEMIWESVAHLSNVRSEVFDGLLADFAANQGASVLLKGLRSMTDFDYETPMAVMNNKMHNELETVFLYSKPEFAHISSSIVKETARFHSLPPGQVPDSVEKRLLQKFSRAD
ncbi:pantetheine-phosphate adenylyltransferase [Alkalicoccus chagannorensis]|uniref:pantetheine-phosphate adenylyltransferase n=1 Tax=Alkalicoccus chagannorensis TaxID=427072 RepID=UPI0004133718|nr:pantetheine-phosphate adenylyltransferase [Alkalicoccus chagannorensis]